MSKCWRYPEYNIIKASSGEEALIQLLKYDFAVILLDVQMPGVDGFETAKIIKAREKTKNIPIIFITANNIDSKHIFLGYSVGAIDYILKPFDPFILKSKVEVFVEMYRINQRNIRQADILLEKTKELEKANQELTRKSLELLESEAITSVISETSIDSMILLNGDGLVIKVNPAFVRMFLYETHEMLGKPIYSLLSDEKSKQFMHAIIASIHTLDEFLEGSNEVNAKRQDGTTFYAEVQIGKRYIKNKCIIACTFRDITKRKQNQELITHMAYHDGLTNLPNRRQFHDVFNAELQRAKGIHAPFSILYLDLDLFKFINDSLGHLIGDKLLQEFSKRLVGFVGEKDFVARLGGDEFVILLPDTSREQAIEIAEKILEGIKHPFHIENYELFITASIGVSIFPYDGEDSSVLLKSADAALYRAKEQGKNTFKIFHSGMNIHSYKSFILQNELRKAIERNELVLYFQPRMDLDTGEITSAEILLRWNHPDWGVLKPSEFIPLAEETGMIVEIGEWIIESACVQIKRWMDDGFAPIRLAVNLSPRQFLQKDLVEKIKGYITDHSIDAGMLEIEIVESILVENEARVRSVLQDIRKLGVRISIDDFGKGYSSLTYLRHLPVQTLKIDKSFIHDMKIHVPDSISLVYSIMSMAQSLRMSVIAEGVETEEQLNILRQKESLTVQGYLICHPVPIHELETFLSNRQRVFKEKSTIHHQAVPDSTPMALESTTDRQEEKQEITEIALSRICSLYNISSRENEVFRLIIDGLSNKEISETLFISEHTVKNHITRILQKLNVSDRLQAMAIVYQACIEESHRTVKL
ncbi:EAL domain-containing protein [Peribacillus acanthi]|uniref:EAL domain-containing protein n=1 Tax=Peribacillus acanthi TaxID=2171554 RepID=UPI000D3E72F9|nr:EAL domain-containing protein [Peribacillus acanthi]